MKKLRKLVTAIAVTTGLTFGSMAFAAPAANAADPTSGTEIVTSEATSSSTTSASAQSVNGVSISSKTKVVSYIQATGATKAQMQGSKIRLAKSMTLWTSYYNTSHQEVWHWKTYPKGKVFVKGSDGWYHDPICWNKVKIKTPKPVGTKIYGAIKVVTKFVFSAVSTSSVKGGAVAKAHAWCQTDTSAAEATGTGTAAFYASATATGSGRTWTLAKEAASSSSASKLTLQVGTATNLKIRLKTEAEGKATADASAKVVCSNPPPVFNAPGISVTPGACVKAGETTGIATVTVSNPNSSASPADVTVGGLTPQHVGSIAAGSSATLTFTGLAPGTYSVTATLTAFNMVATTQVTIAQCENPTMVLSIDQMNDIDQSVAPASGPIQYSWTDLLAHAVAPSGAGNVSYTVNSSFGSVKFVVNGTKNLVQASGTYDLSLRYTAPTEVPTTTCSNGIGKCDTITITSVFAGKTYSASTEIRINPTPTPPL